MLSTYRSLCTRFYDTDKPVAPAADLAFYRGHAEQCGGPILEPMCGTGRFLIPLAEAGFDIDGYDASPAMLDACHAKLARSSHTPRVTQAMFESFVANRQYALAIIPSGSICLITDPAALKAGLERLRDSLLPGGSLVFEVDRCQMKTSSSWPWGGRWVKCADGSILIVNWLGRFDAATRISHSIMRYELVREGKILDTEVEPFDLRLYEPDELEPILRSAGFTDVRIHRRFEGALQDGDGEFVVECRRG